MVCMTPDDWAELMEEPPGGENHGRTRAGGRMRDLNGQSYEAFSRLKFIIRDPTWEQGRRHVKPSETVRHGTLAAYKHDKCRCELCRKANREWVRNSRSVEP